MLDKISWQVFEKTGNIDAYLLYIDLKNLNISQDIDTSVNSHINIANVN